MPVRKSWNTGMCMAPVDIIISKSDPARMK